MDRILKLELGPLYVELYYFREIYFRRVVGLEIAFKAVFKKCIEGSNLLFSEEGWSGWPKNVN